MKTKEVLKMKEERKRMHEINKIRAVMMITADNINHEFKRLNIESDDIKKAADIIYDEISSCILKQASNLGGWEMRLNEEREEHERRT